MLQAGQSDPGGGGKQVGLGTGGIAQVFNTWPRTGIAGTRGQVPANSCPHLCGFYL